MEDLSTQNLQENQKDADEQLKEDIYNKAKKSEDIQVKRVPTFTMSSCAKAGTMMPVHFAPETLNALFKLKSEGINFDEFVTDRLQYPNKLAMCNALNAEQVDGVALAIYQIERGKSLIVGDMAGIGKGRIASAVLRYAYLKKKIPIFITERPNLFSDLYRDIADIGGFGLRNNNYITPKPIILNGYKPNDENSIKRGDDVLFTAQKNAEVIQILSEAVDNDKFPFKDYQLVLGTYSQFSTEQDNTGKDKLKVKYIKELAKNAIFILDESHNAVGLNSGVGRFFRDMATISAGCLFLSATSAKRAEQLQLYGIRTDIVESSAKDPKTLLDIIKKGGEPMSEYLSSSLASVGQQIRRERSFEKCKFEYLVISEEGKKNKIFELYDRTINQYNEILEFMKGVQGSSTTEKLLKRVVKKIKTKHPDFNITNEVRPEDDEELEEWYKRNEGMYEYFIDFKAVKSTRFIVIDTLVMAIKAEFVAEQAVKQLTEPRDYEYLDGRVLNTTIKPIIAVRNTLDNIWDKMGYSIGQEIKDPDFKIVLESSLKTALNPNIRFKKVIFETDEEKKERKKKKQKTKKKKERKSSTLPDEFSGIPFDSERITLKYEDFEDKGEALKNLEIKISNFNAGIFVSPIDKILEIIQSTARNNNDKHGEGSRYLRVAEVTGRKKKLVKENGKWYLQSVSADTDEKNAFDKFKGYNNGKYDCLIINEVGSTGASAQASKKYKDSRPRSMIIHQVELDVNTEVQKRGRINRTGQICLPTYTYLTSPIPSEIRRLLMLKRKLRSLDSLTAGSQKQSDELATFRNKRNDEIKDFYNYIGLKVLNEWLMNPDNNEYNTFFEVNADHIAKANRKNNEEKFVDDFCRIMELSTCKFQEDFYDAINTEYIKEEEHLIATNNYLLETTIEDLESSLKAKAETKYGLNTSPFNSSVFDEELYVSIRNPSYTKIQLESLVNELCKNKTPDAYWKELRKDYEMEFEKYITDVIPEQYPLPKKSDYPNTKEGKEDYQNAVMEIELRKEERIKKERDNSDKIKKILERYRPDTAYSVPDFDDFAAKMEEYQAKNNGAKPNPNKEPSFIYGVGRYLGRFVGYNIDSNAKFKYSNGSIELVFAFIEGLKKLVIKPTNPLSMDVLEWIPYGRMLDEDRVKIDNWEIDEKKKTVARFLTGNIIDALKIAENRKKSGEISSYKYIKFTTRENDIRGGVHIRFGDNYEPLKVSNIKPSIPIISPAFKEALDSFEEYDYAHSNTGGVVERFVCEEVNGEEIIKLIIIGEKLTYNAATGNYRVLETGAKYKSKFYGDKNLERFIKVPASRAIREYVDYGMAKKPKQYFRSDEYIFTSKTDQEGLFKYMYDVDKCSFNFRKGTSSPENVPNLPRPADDDDDKKDEKREQGAFEYINIEKYEPQDKNIPYYVSHRKGEMQYIITTSKMLTPIECVTYSLQPYNLTYNQMASNFLSKFAPKERLELKDEVNSKYKGDGKFYPVGSYISIKAKEKYASPMYVFGKLYLAPAIIGEIMYQYLNSDNADLREQTKKEAEETKRQEIKVEIKPISEANIQDYLILLNS